MYELVQFTKNVHISDPAAGIASNKYRLRHDVIYIPTLHNFRIESNSKQKIIRNTKVAHHIISYHITRAAATEINGAHLTPPRHSLAKHATSSSDRHPQTTGDGARASAAVVRDARRRGSEREGCGSG